MPLLGWDSIELWVGNAKQAAYFYEHAMGFSRTAYSGPETGVRDRASYVLEQGDIRLVVTSAVREESDITKHHARHGDGVKDIALTVPDATEAYRQAVQRGARGVAEPKRRSKTSSGRSRLRRSRRTATRSTPSSTARTTRARSSRATSRCRRTARRTRRRRASEHRPHRRQRRARPNERLGRVLRARLRDDRDDQLHRRRHLDRVLGADVEGDGGRRRQDQVPDQRAGRGQAQEPDRGVHRVLRRRRRAAHRARLGEHRRDRRGAEGARR